jgi:hypothetical protein
MIIKMCSFSCRTNQVFFKKQPCEKSIVSKANANNLNIKQIAMIVETTQSQC